MQTNPVKQKLMDGGVSVGTMMFEFKSPGVARAAARAGAEFSIFDMEHTGWSIETIRSLCTACHGTDMLPLVRVPATEYHFIARVLDVGSSGIMMPMVETREQAELLVQSAKYPPHGRRGSAFCIAHDDYSGGTALETMEQANRDQILIAQIETVTGVENVEAIAALDGIDCLWIGQSDLSSSLGVAGQFDHPVFVAAVDRIIKACHDHGKTGGFMTTTLEFGEWVVQQGFRMLAWSGDIWIYQQALKSGLDSMRGFAESG